MNRLFEQASKTYKAIHGYPFKEWDPWYNASDTPFNGMPVELVSELCDKREVVKYLRQWKKEHTPNFFRPKSWVKLVSGPTARDVKEGYLVEIRGAPFGDLALVASIHKPKMEFFNKSDLKSIIPPPGDKDLLELGLGRDLANYKIGAKVIASTHLRRRYNLWDKVVEGVVEEEFIIPEGFHHYTDENSAVPSGSVRWNLGISGLYRHMIYDILPK